MKSSERCQYHYQGDYCRKADGHEGNHQGAHNEFSDTELVATTELQRSTIRTIVRERL